jgi:hypothetical protein
MEDDSNKVHWQCVISRTWQSQTFVILQRQTIPIKDQPNAGFHAHLLRCQCPKLCIDSMHDHTCTGKQKTAWPACRGSLAHWAGQTHFGYGQRARDQKQTCVDAGVARALLAEHGTVDLPDAAAGHGNAIELVKELLHRGIERALYNMLRKLQPVRWRLHVQRRKSGNNQWVKGLADPGLLKMRFSAIQLAMLVLEYSELLSLKCIRLHIATCGTLQSDVVPQERAVMGHQEIFAQMTSQLLAQSRH